VSKDLQSVIVSTGLSLSEALGALDDSAGKVLFVVDEAGLLQGALTDGDIRRHLLAGQSLSDSVVAAMNAEPVWVPQGTPDEAVRELLVARQIECVPVLDDAGRIVRAVWWMELFRSAHAPRASIDVPVAIMAGGKGTRLEPYTRILPKPLMPVGDVPVLQLIMDRLHEQGMSRFVVSLNFKASLIRAYFSDVAFPYDVEFIEEPEPLGTAGSLRLMAPYLDGTFVLANCDTIVDSEFADIVAHHRASGNVVTIVASVKHLVLPYGVCDVGEGGLLVALREKPRYDLLVSTGVYIMEPEALNAIAPHGPTDATDLINVAMDSGARVGVYPISERSWLDVGQLEELQDALDRLGVR
jgi:dTDP-glucose pyrophosphorylase